MQIEGLISIALTFVLAFAMKLPVKKWSIVVIPHRKCSRKGGTGSKHVDSNTVVERPLQSYRRDSPTGFWYHFGLVVTDVDAFIGSRLTKRIVIHDIPLLIVIFESQLKCVTDYRLFVFLREDRDISHYSYPSTAWSLERTSTFGLLFHGISMHGSSRYVSNLRLHPCIR
jgi:hypothetical protein